MPRKTSETLVLTAHARGNFKKQCHATSIFSCQAATRPLHMPSKGVRNSANSRIVGANALAQLRTTTKTEESAPQDCRGTLSWLNHAAN